jgi:succinoglycan biosynthesis transport protein ExoP
MTKIVSSKNMIVTNSNQHNAHEQDEKVDYSQYIRTLKRGKWLILLLTIICLILGGLVASIATPVYLSSSKIIADPQKPSANTSEQYIASSMVFLFYNTQYEIIKSRFIAESVVDDLGLVSEYKNNQLNNKKSTDSWLGELKKSFFSYIKSNDEKKSKILTDSEIRIIIATEIASKLKVSGGQKSQIINLSYESPNAEKSTQIVNAISQAYIQFGLESRLAEVKNTETWYSEESDELKTKLKGAENRLQKFRISQKLVGTGQQQKDLSTRLSSLNKELIDSKNQLNTIEQQYFRVKELKKDSPSLYSLEAVIQSNAANDLVKEVAMLTRTVNELNERYREKHPKMIKAKTALRSAEVTLDKTLEKIVDGIKDKYKFARLNVEDIEGLIDSEKMAMQQLQGNNFELNSLEREVENNQRIYESFLTQMMVTNIQNDFTGSNIQIIDYATIPKFPIKPNKQLIIIFASFVGVFLGMILVLAREVINDTFKTPDDIQAKLALSALGITPIVIKDKDSTIPEKQYLNDSRSAFAESINTIRTGLIFANIDNPPKTILVTSATSSEGKTTLALNMAIAFSNIGKTLLLEVDLRVPSIRSSLGYSEKLGLSDILSGEAKVLSDVIRDLNNGQLNIITSGTVPPNPMELLSSNKFEKLLASLCLHYEYIILDGPPTLPVSDSCILANKVDAVVFAVKAEKTKIKVAKEALSRLRKLNANVFGGVLTVAEPKKMNYYGEHYYSGEYYGVKPDKLAPAPAAT